jgi:hypothetical protein
LSLEKIIRPSASSPANMRPGLPDRTNSTFGPCAIDCRRFGDGAQNHLPQVLAGAQESLALKPGFWQFFVK